MTTTTATTATIGNGKPFTFKAQPSELDGRVYEVWRDGDEERGYLTFTSRECAERIVDTLNRPEYADWSWDELRDEAADIERSAR